MGLSVALGRELARAVTGTPVEDLALPLSEPEPLPAQVQEAAEVMRSGGGTMSEYTVDVRHAGDMTDGEIRARLYVDGSLRGTFNNYSERTRYSVERAIKGMLPHNSLGRQMLKKLKVYAGPEHPHAAQQPQNYEIKQVAQ